MRDDQRSSRRPPLVGDASAPELGRREEQLLERRALRRDGAHLDAATAMSHASTSFRPRRLGQRERRPLGVLAPREHRAPRRRHLDERRAGAADHDGVSGRRADQLADRRDPDAAGRRARSRRDRTASRRRAGCATRTAPSCRARAARGSARARRAGRTGRGRSSARRGSGAPARAPVRRRARDAGACPSNTCGAASRGRSPSPTRPSHSRRARARPRPREPREPTGQLQVLEAVQVVVEVRLLGKEPEAPSARGALDRLAEHPCLPARRPEEPGEQLQRRGLAGAVRTEVAQHLAAPNFEIEGVDSRATLSVQGFR